MEHKPLYRWLGISQWNRSITLRREGTSGANERMPHNSSSRSIKNYIVSLLLWSQDLTWSRLSALMHQTLYGIVGGRVWAESGLWLHNWWKVCAAGNPEENPQASAASPAAETFWDGIRPWVIILAFHHNHSIAHKQSTLTV